MANMADIAAMIAEVALPNVLFKANRTLIKSLKNNCSGLFETASQFRNLCTRMRIVNFYELQALGGRLVCALISCPVPESYTAQIVDRSSALMNLPGERQTALNANHRTLCRYEDENDINYVVLRDTVVEMMQLTTPPSKLSDIFSLKKENY